MPSSGSRHFLPLPSAIFKSRSTANLRPSSQAHPYVSTYAAATEIVLPQIYEEGPITFVDRPDDAITALPANLHKNGSRLVSRQLSKSPPPLPTRKRSKATWARFTKSLRSQLRFLKPRSKRADKEEKPKLIIGPPTNFQHLGGAELLLQELYGQQNAAQAQQARAEQGYDSEWEDIEEEQRNR